uniref:Uncharacterized protein n=1 Tax=Aegilops tauschii subsp. strangulata TaxID=200361 RepID=A0A453P2R1_AEGTS
MAVQYMKEAPVLISDADAVRVSAEYILNGDKELILAFLWNMFIHMQVNLHMSFSISLLMLKFYTVLFHLSFVLKRWTNGLTLVFFTHCIGSITVEICCTSQHYVLPS